MIHQQLCNYLQLQLIKLWFTYVLISWRRTLRCRQCPRSRWWWWLLSPPMWFVGLLHLAGHGVLKRPSITSPLPQCWLSTLQYTHSYTSLTFWMAAQVKCLLVRFIYDTLAQSHLTPSPYPYPLFSRLSGPLKWSHKGEWFKSSPTNWDSPSRSHYIISCLRENLSRHQ